MVNFDSRYYVSVVRWDLVKDTYCAYRSKMVLQMLNYRKCIKKDLNDINLFERFLSDTHITDE